MKNKHRILEYLYIIIGSAIAGLSIVIFTTPAKIAPGGVSGIGTLLYHLFGWDVGLSILCLSIPIFLIGVLQFGKTYGIKSLIGSLLLSLFTSLFGRIFGYEGILDYSKDISFLLSCLFGGVLTGCGLGIVMKSGANTGGTDILAQILARYTHMALGTALMVVDALVIIASVFIFSLESAMYAIIVVYITSMMINKVVLSIGTNYAKSIYIVSNKLDEIGHYILTDLDRSGTLVSAKGLYSKTERPMLLTIVPNQYVAKLTREVHKIDPAAFMIIQDTYHVLGEGFTPIEEVARKSKNDVTQV